MGIIPSDNEQIQNLQQQLFESRKLKSVKIIKQEYYAMTELAAEIYGKFQDDTEQQLKKKTTKIKDLEKMIGRGKR